MNGISGLLPYAAGYFFLLNLLGFALMGYDKGRAKARGWRIPEKTLFLVAALGGSIGSLLGMSVFHHKTKHKRFVVGIPVILLIQVSLGTLIWFHLG